MNSCLFLMHRIRGNVTCGGDRNDKHNGNCGYYADTGAGEPMPQKVFERHADAYDDWFVLHRTVYRAECERIRQALPAPDARTIEVGVGSGRFAAPLGIPIGIEPSVSLGRMACQRGIEVIRGVGEFLPLKNESCSSVLMVTAFLGYPPMHKNA